MTEKEASSVPDYVSPIASPMANEKTVKRIGKLVKKAGKDKQLKRGIKEVVKAIRKNATGIVFLAGNVDPIDVMSHIPVMLEEANVPYIYVPTKEFLGSSAQSKRSISVVMVLQPKNDEIEWKETYDKVQKEMLKFNA